MSKNKARKEVAKILTEMGHSLRRGDHGEPLPVTVSAIRNWEENPESYPVATASAPEFLKTIEREIEANGLHTIDEVVQLLRELAAKHLPTMFAY